MPVYFRTPSRKRLHKMNRRQHKKLHLGEFQTLIFGVQGSLHQAEDDAEAFGRFMDELIAYLVVNGFEMAGGGRLRRFFVPVSKIRCPKLGRNREKSHYLLAGRPRRCCHFVRHPAG